MGNALKTLLQKRHIHAYSAFVSEYQRHAAALDFASRPAPPTKVQYYRWVSDRTKTLPRPHHCAVLESMFPDWTARELFGLDEHQVKHPDSPTADDDVLAAIGPAIEHALLAGLWCSGYILNGDQHHVDLATVTATKHGVRSRNYPPEPRFEGHQTGHQTDLSARLVGRHLMGYWRNHNDAYYFGSVHLIVLPGETMLDGYCTGFLNDGEVLAQPWRWVRIAPQSYDGVDVAAATLKDPVVLYNILAEHTHFDGALSLSDVTER